MPYRRLPNTDAARIKALRTAIDKASEINFNDLPISTKLLASAKDALKQFETLCLRYRQKSEIQIKANKSFIVKAKNARMYISHFMQVFYMSVTRSEIKVDQLKHYGLEDANMVVPDLTSNDQLLEWGRKIIDGENIRIANGGVPIYNPSIAKVNVMYSIFKDGYQTQKMHQKGTTRVMEEVAAYRKIVDKIILEIWDQVEKNSEYMSSEMRIRRNREFGIIYYYRKGEVAE